MLELKNIVRENILQLLPYSCARDEYKCDEGIFLDANENPYGNLNRYPDPYQIELKKSISEIKNIPIYNIFLGNGSDEVIDLTFRIFCNPGKDKALIFTPTYGMYEVSANFNDISLIKIPLTESFQIDSEKVIPYLNDTTLKLIFICSPNNPTGNSINSETLQKIINSFNGIVILDEAYIDFSEHPSFLSAINKFPNLIVMQTLSKAYGLAGVRIGMAFGSKNIIQLYSKVKPPYNISSVNQRAAIEKLRNIEVIRKEIDILKSERIRVANDLKKMSIIKRVYKSDANFLLVKVQNANATYRYLLDKKVIVRNRNSVIQSCIRITIGKPEENNLLLAALEEMVLKNGIMK